MSAISAIFLAVGISLFVFGMYLIKYGLEKNYGERLKKVLSDFTGNRFCAIATGIFVTFAMQSSSASSVLTAAFVDSGYISLSNAFWIIVGANIGTTFTGLFTALDISEYAPVLAVVGVISISFCKKERNINTGVLLTGLGIIYTGLHIMNNSVCEIKEWQSFNEIIAMCSSPLQGILTGAFCTSVIQSSSVITAVLQTLAGEGIINIRQAYFIILGANIGTCATCAIASAGLKRTARWVAVMHVLYNLGCAVLFLLISFIIPLPEIIEKSFPGGIKIRIAVLNIMFNSVPALLISVIPLNLLKRGRVNKKRLV